MSKTLLDRIKPEVLEALQEKYRGFELEYFELVYNDVIRQLKGVNYVTDMRYDLALTLQGLLPIIFPDDKLASVWSCFFGIHEMDKLDNELYEHSAE
jgi:hypothetical protein